jgi:hypothetical protein
VQEANQDYQRSYSTMNELEKRTNDRFQQQPFPWNDASQSRSTDGDKSTSTLLYEKMRLSEAAPAVDFPNPSFQDFSSLILSQFFLVSFPGYQNAC